MQPRIPSPIGAERQRGTIGKVCCQMLLRSTHEAAEATQATRGTRERVQGDRKLSPLLSLPLRLSLSLSRSLRLPVCPPFPPLPPPRPTPPPLSVRLVCTDGRRTFTQRSAFRCAAIIGRCERTLCLSSGQSFSARKRRLFNALHPCPSRFCATSTSARVFPLFVVNKLEALGIGMERGRASKVEMNENLENKNPL